MRNSEKLKLGRWEGGKTEGKKVRSWEVGKLGKEKRSA